MEECFVKDGYVKYIWNNWYLYIINIWKQLGIRGSSVKQVWNKNNFRYSATSKKYEFKYKFECITENEYLNSKGKCIACQNNEVCFARRPIDIQDVWNILATLNSKRDVVCYYHHI